MNPKWKEALLWAIVIAIALELGINLVFGRTVWHRLTALERSVQQLQHHNELEELEKR